MMYVTIFEEDGSEPLPDGFVVTGDDGRVPLQMLKLELTDDLRAKHEVALLRAALRSVGYVAVISKEPREGAHYDLITEKS